MTEQQTPLFSREAMIEEMIATRRAIHSRPEEGWTEFETTHLVAERLKALGLAPLLGTKVISPEAVMGRDPALVERAMTRALEAGVPQSFLDETEGYTGCAAVIETGRPGPVTAFRFDMDCVLVEESEDDSHESVAGGYRSVRPGLMHACGHDAHTAVGLEAARWLVQNKESLKGAVKLLFQPAEEGVRGGGAMAASGIVDDVDWIFGGHIGTFAKLGEVGLSRGGFLASTKVDVRFTGAPSHAGSDPQKGRSALMAACSAAMMMEGIPRHGEGVTRISIGRLNAGEGRNVTPAHASMQLEVRGETVEINEYMFENVKNIVEGVEKAYGVEAEIVKAGESATLIECPEAVEIVRRAAQSVKGVSAVLDFDKPSGSEDFTMLLKRVVDRGGKGAFFLFGCSHHGHHRPDFAVQDEQSLPVGLDVFTSIARLVNGL